MKIAFENAFFSLACRLSILLFFSSLILTGCVVPVNRGTYEQAKTDYQHGYPERAFVQLWRPAQLRDPRALYALGYMYYYGIGTDKDIDMGRKLIQRSADLHYPPGIEGIRIIYSQLHEQYGAFDNPAPSKPYPPFRPRRWRR